MREAKRLLDDYLLALTAVDAVRVLECKKICSLPAEGIGLTWDGMAAEDA
jgi:hypothetical protein